MNSPQRPGALKSKDSSLVNAAREGDVPALMRLCDEGAKIDEQDSAGSSTALMTAANWGKDECVEFLLSRGASIDLQDRDGRTPLIFAVTMTRIACVKILVIHGADPNRCSKNGWSPLYIACNKGSLEIVEILVSFPYSSRPGVPRINIDIQNSVGGTSLMVASMHGHVDIVKLLVKLQATVNMIDNNRWNAAMKAADKGNTEVVSILIEHGADVKAADNNGFSSLALAAKAGKEATVRVLLDNERMRPDINFQDKNGRTALFYAAQNGHLEAVRELWSRGADVTIQDKNGKTALAVAKDSAIQELLQRPAPAYTPPALLASAPTAASLSTVSVEEAPLHSGLSSAPEPIGLDAAAAAVPLSGEKSGDLGGAHTDALLQTQMGSLAVSSPFVSLPPPLSSSSAVSSAPLPPQAQPVVVVEPDAKMRAEDLHVETEMEVEIDPEEETEKGNEEEEVNRKRKATSSPPSAHKAGSFAKGGESEFISLEYGDIPEYLRSGAFFLSLSGEPDDAIVVLAKHFKEVDSVETVGELYQMLHVMKFWVLSAFPRGVIAFCHTHHISMWDNVAADVFDTSDKVLVDLLDVFKDNGSPLVRAMELGRSEVVHYLVEIRYGCESLSPSVAAASCGSLPYLKLLHESGYPLNVETTAAAARGGHVECLNYLHEKKCPWDASTHAAAALGGHLECMKFALDHGLNFWSEEVCTAAAEGGNLDCLMFARQMGCLWDDTVTFKATEAGLSDDILENRALEVGRSACLQFALQNGCPIHKDACSNAAAGGHLDYLKILHEHVPPAPWDADTTLAAVKAGSVECLTYLHRQGCPWDTRTPDAAAIRGDAILLRYAIGNWCPYDADLMRLAAAARTNSLACLKFLIGEQGMYMHEDGSVFGAALLRADLECLRYLINFDCPFRSYKFQVGQDWIIIDVATFDDRLSQCITLAYRFGWRWNDAFAAHVKATTAPPLTKCCALLDGRGPSAPAPARTVPSAASLWTSRPGFLFTNK